MLRQRAEISGRGDRPVSGWLGFALLNEERYGGSMSRVQPFTVNPGSVTYADLDSEVSPAFDLADRHYLRAFAVCAGRVSVYSRAVWISPGTHPPEQLSSSNGTKVSRP